MIDPSIPLSGRPMRRLDPVAKLGDLLQLQALRGVIQDREEARTARATGQEAERARETILRQLFSRDQPPTEQDVRNSGLSFNDSQTVIKMIQAMTDEQRVKRLKDWEITRDIFGGLKLFDPATRDQIWQQAVGRGKEMGIANIPDQFDEGWLNMATSYGQTPREAPRPILVGPEGGTLADPLSGQPLSTIAPTKPPRTPTVGSFEDYVTQRFGPRPTAQQLAQAKATYREPVAEPGFQRAQVLDEQGNLVEANYQPRTGVYTDVNTGQRIMGVQAKPTAEIRNRQDALKGLVPTLKNLRSLSDSILTRVGPSQRVEALKRGAEAVFGTDPDFRTYQDFRAALGVMIAVATQGSRPSDADVFRAALPMVPDPYRDTRESAGQKWDLIFKMFEQRLSADMKRQLESDSDSPPGADAPSDQNDPLGIR